MATTLPGSPPSFKRNDVSLTVKQLCSYLHVLHETLDFMLGQIKKTLDIHQKQIEEHEKSIQSMKRSILSMQDDIDDLYTKYNRLAARVSALEEGGGTQSET